MFNDPRASVRTFIIDNFLFGDAASMPDDKASLLEGGVLDSTGVLELVGFIEETWEIEMADDEIVPDNLDSVVKIAAFVMTKKADLAA
ncbi:acyl carrier protein [Rhizobium sp.]